MKLSKSFMKKILILILSVFVLVPIILMLFGYDKTISEGFYTPTTPSNDMDLTDKTGAGKMDYVVINDNDKNSYARQAENDEIKETNGTDSKLYCIFGDISCNLSGYELVDHRSGQTDDYGNKRKGCKRRGQNRWSNNFKCVNSIFDEKDSYTFYKLDSSNCIDADSSSVTLNSLQEDYGELSGNNTLFKGFSTLIDNSSNVAPFDISDSSSYLTMKFGDGTDISYSTCFLFDTSSNCATQAGCSPPSEETEESDEPEPASENELNTKCLGDFGDGVGDKLCCGQTGVIQNEHAKYTCPESHPYCRGYKCGESWGKCYNIEDED